MHQPITSRRSSLARLALLSGLALAAGLTALLPVTASAQAAFPSRPITIVLPYPPGGSADTISRLVGDRLGAALGQPVIVQNRAGGSSAVGLNAVNAAPADGYTLFFAASTLTTQAAVNRVFATALDKQLLPLSEVVRGPFLIAANTAVQANGVKELVEFSKQNPNALNYGSTGIASSVHFTVEAFKSATGARLTHVPFSGSAPALNAALANQVQLVTDPVFLLKPQIEQGKLKAIAVTGATRSPLLPNVPTVAESGYPGFDAPAWWAVLASSKTPPEIVKRMNEELNKALKNPEVAKKLDSQGIDVAGGSVEQAAAFIDKQVTTWAKVVKDNHIKAD